MENTFKRDSNNALINQDNAGLTAYRTRRENALKVDDIERQINTVKSELEEIRSLLLQLLRKE